MKKLIALALALVMMWVAVLPVCAVSMGSIYSYIGGLKVEPGDTRADNPVYNYAWLDNVIIRYDPNAVTSAVVTPTPEDYPYSQTYDEFIEESKNYNELLKLDENTVAAAYQELSAVLFYMVTALGFTDEYETMRQYLVEYGISLPVNETAQDKMSIAVVYAVLKYNAVYILYNKNVSLPVGASLDESMVMVLSALMGIMLPSGIETLTGFGVLSVKNYVTQFESLPISNNPETPEIFHWAKVITAAESGYKVPLAAYDEATTAQKEYVDYAYYASILSLAYDVQIDPIYLVLAMQSKEELALQKFILKTMLDEKQASYTEDMTCEQLFDLACQNGYFALEDEFYSDICSYKLTVPASCEKIWFTPFSLAGQLEGGDDAFVSIYLNGVQMSPNSTVSTAVNPSAAEETVELRVVYDNKANLRDEAVYKFRLIKDKSLDKENNTVAENDLVGKVEQFIDTIVPNENTAAKQKVDEVFSAIDSGVSQVGQDVLTTFSVESTDSVTEYFDVTAQATTGTSGGKEWFDFEYLDELLDGVYVTDADGNIVTSYYFSSEETETSQQNIISKVTETVKESPEVVAVPSSLLAAFSFAGYFMSKKHRDNKDYIRDERDDEDTEE